MLGRKSKKDKVLQKDKEAQTTLGRVFRKGFYKQKPNLNNKFHRTLEGKKKSYYVMWEGQKFH